MRDCTAGTVGPEQNSLPRMSALVTLGPSSRHHHRSRSSRTCLQMMPLPGAQRMSKTSRCRWTMGQNRNRRQLTMNPSRTPPRTPQNQPPMCPMKPAILEGALSDDDVAVSTHWMVQGAKVHIIRGESDGRLLPWCRDAPFSQDPRSTGEGFSLVSRQRFCQRCLARMPRGLYRALARHCGWLN